MREIRNITELTYNNDGLIPAIIQDAVSGKVLMLAYMNKESLQKSLETGETWFFSRSRRELWHKGATSGHIQRITKIYYDCDADTLLVLAQQAGGVSCHEGFESCFHYELLEDGKGRMEAALPFFQKNALGAILNELHLLILDRQEKRPEGSYTTYLFEKGLDKILKKIGEEASEVIIAAKNPDAGELIYEVSDFLYHLLVLLAERGIDMDRIAEELNSRKK